MEDPRAPSMNRRSDRVIASVNRPEAGPARSLWSLRTRRNPALLRTPDAPTAVIVGASRMRIDACADEACSDGTSASAVLRGGAGGVPLAPGRRTPTRRPALAREQVRTHEPELGVRLFARGPPQRFVHRRRRRDARPGAGAWSSGPTPRSAPPAARTSPRSAASGSATCPSPSRPPSRGSYALLGAGFGDPRLAETGAARPSSRASGGRSHRRRSHMPPGAGVRPAWPDHRRGGQCRRRAAGPPVREQGRDRPELARAHGARTAVRRRQPGLL